MTLEYGSPGGALGAAAARLLGAEPGQLLEEDLRRFKQLVECGEIATTLGQPSGKGRMLGRRDISFSKRAMDALSLLGQKEVSP